MAQGQKYEPLPSLDSPLGRYRGGIEPFAPGVHEPLQFVGHEVFDFEFPALKDGWQGLGNGWGDAQGPSISEVPVYLYVFVHLNPKLLCSPRPIGHFRLVFWLFLHGNDCFRAKITSRAQGSSRTIKDPVIHFLRHQRAERC